jgi:uncharacterized protein YfiM (DUF2279 family)
MKYLWVLLVFTATLSAQFRMLDWEQDKWNSTNGHFSKYDKVEHCIGSAGLTFSLIHLIGEKKGVNYSLLAGFLWEVKDGFVSWEKYGELGGEGFSSKDFLADILGVFIGWSFYKLYQWIF